MNMSKLGILFVLFIGVSVVTGCGGVSVVKDEEVVESGEQDGADVEGVADDTGVGDGTMGDGSGRLGAVDVSEEEFAERERLARIAEQEAQEAMGPSEEVSRLAEETGKLHTVHFDYDSYTLSEGDKALLDESAKWLEANVSSTIRIEGHTDDRGSDEYNLALGQRRAESVNTYLWNLGISPNRLSTLSYGEEKPVEMTHDEQGWGANRRAELVIVGR